MAPEEQATKRSEDEQISDVVGLIMAGSGHIARQNYPPKIFNRGLRQAQALGYAVGEPEEPESPS